MGIKWHAIKTKNAGTRNYAIQNTGGTAEHRNTDGTPEHWRKNRNTMELRNRRTPVERRSNKATPRNNTNTERRHIQQAKWQNSKQESYFSKKDFYEKFKAGQETVFM